MKAAWKSPAVDFHPFWRMKALFLVASHNLAFAYVAVFFFVGFVFPWMEAKYDIFLLVSCSV